MAIIHQAPGQGLVQQPAQAFIDTSPKRPIFRDGVSARQSSLDPAKSFEKYFGRVHRRYKSMDTTNIENLANRLLQENNPTLTKLVKEKIFLRDTFKNRFIEAKTPLGEVLQELQNSQESSGRKLLSKEILIQAEKEAGELTKKEVALATEKGQRKSVSNEIAHLLKRQAAVATKIGPEFLVNNYTTNGQSNPSAATLSNGKFVVTWTSDGQDGSNSGVFGQIFNTDGTKSGSEFPVNTYTTSLQSRPSVASLNNGRFVITWDSWKQDGDRTGVYGQIVNANGTKSGSEFQVNTCTSYNQYSSFAASLSNGEFVVTWQSEYQDGSDYGIYGQIFNADGTKNGSEFLVNTYTTGRQSVPSAARLSDDKFVVVWLGLDQNGLKGALGQIFANGTKSGSEFQLNTDTRGSQGVPSVASLNNDTFIVAWTVLGMTAPAEGIYGQIFNTNGTKNGSEFQLNIGGSLGKPSVTSLNNDTFVAIYRKATLIFGQLFKTDDGAKSGSEFQVSTNTSNWQARLSVASLSNDQFVVTWDGDGQADTAGVYAQIFKEAIPTTSTSTSSTSATSTSATSTSRTSSTSKQTEASANVISGAKRQTNSIALTAFAWMAQTIKGTLGY